MLRRQWITGALILFAAALTLAQTAAPTAAPTPSGPRRAASPAGTAATQVGGTWVNPESEERRYTGGKWIEITYSRPILRDAPTSSARAATTARPSTRERRCGAWARTRRRG